jgi:hypothetical protein
MSGATDKNDAAKELQTERTITADHMASFCEIFLRFLYIMLFCVMISLEMTIYYLCAACLSY